MSYRDVQTGISAGASIIGTLYSIPGIGQVAQLASDIVGAFSLANEQQAYNAMLMRYYATPVQLGGGYNPGTRTHSYSSMIARRRRIFFNRVR